MSNVVSRMPERQYKKYTKNKSIIAFMTISNYNVVYIVDITKPGILHHSMKTQCPLAPHVNCDEYSKILSII